MIVSSKFNGDLGAQGGGDGFTMALNCTSEQNEVLCTSAAGGAIVTVAAGICACDCVAVDAKRTGDDVMRDWSRGFSVGSNTFCTRTLEDCLGNAGEVVCLTTTCGVEAIVIGGEIITVCFGAGNLVSDGMDRTEFKN